MRIIFFFMVLLIAVPAYGAWFIQATDEMKEISDAPYEFKLGIMSCGVTKTLFIRAPDDSIIESRELYCWTSDDTCVSTTVNVNYPLYSAQTLNIKNKKDHYMPTLMSGPKEKGVNKKLQGKQ